MIKKQTHTYRFLVDTNKTDFELFVLAESDYTTLEYEENEYMASFRTILEVPVEVQGKTFKVKAKSELGDSQEYTIELVHRSDNTKLEYLKVDDIIREPDEVWWDTYIVMIERDATQALIEVKTEHEFANIRIGDNIIASGLDKGVLDCPDLTQKRILVPVVVTVADGTTVKTYNIVLIRGCSSIYARYRRK